MTEKEVSLIVKLSEVIKKLSPEDKIYLLGIADGMGMAFAGAKKKENKEG